MKKNIVISNLYHSKKALCFLAIIDASGYIHCNHNAYWKCTQKHKDKYNNYK